MPDTDTAATGTPAQRKRNWMLWAGVLVTLLAILSNWLFLAKFPGQDLLPWFSLLLFIIPVPMLVTGLRRAIAQPQIYRGKVAGWIFTVLSVLLLAFAVLLLYSSRNIPHSLGAPKVGEKAPDFVLPDTARKNVALHDLLSAPMENGAPPKAVLLVFYRGYW